MLWGFVFQVNGNEWMLQPNEAVLNKAFQGVVDFSLFGCKQ